MQTFLPYPSFCQSAQVLDYRRLGKQRVEAKQILMCLLGEGSQRWSSHPAVKMWRGYEFALTVYGTHVCYEWRLRGYRDTCYDYFMKKHNMFYDDYALRMPLWLGDNAFHASHRSNLLRKNPDHYCQFGWTESHDLSYVWPIR